MVRCVCLSLSNRGRSVFDFLSVRLPFTRTRWLMENLPIGKLTTTISLISPSPSASSAHQLPRLISHHARTGPSGVFPRFATDHLAPAQTNKRNRIRTRTRAFICHHPLTRKPKAINKIRISSSRSISSNRSKAPGAR